MVAISATSLDAANRPHDVIFKPASYAAAQGAQLHRYTDPDFVERFLADIATTAPHDFDWMATDRFGDYDDHVTLRLPVHRTFYQVSIEICCDRLGQPALNPNRIASAGFVLRRVGGGRNDAWMMANGTAIGWQPHTGEERDPDLSKRICRKGDTHTEPQPAYSGEEVHPLRSTLQNLDGRSRTILYGYLPLGGHHFYRSDPEPPEPVADEATAATTFKSLQWPFGDRGAPASKALHPVQVNRGIPSPAFADLLVRLVLEEHLAARDDELAQSARQMNFYNLAAGLSFDFSAGAFFSDHTRGSYQHARRFSLFDYVTEWATSDRDELLDWAMRYMEAGTRTHLPPRQGHEGQLDLWFLVSSGDAQELRGHLQQTVQNRFDAAQQEIPVPKFQQREIDVYQVVPFVRYVDDDGLERICWAREEDRSDSFRVAAPFDPEASRPSLVQVPSLKDLKRGLAKGVGLLTPSDTMDMMNRLRTDEGMVPDILPEGDPPPSPGTQWLCSFSIPIVTVAAMIVLMIIVSILNFFLQWLPFVRICFPLPSIEEKGP